MISFWIPLLFLILSVIAFMGANTWVKKYTVHADNTKDCIASEHTECANDPNCCMIWHDGMCRKGKRTGGGTTCTAPGHLGPGLLMILAVILFLVFLITLVWAIVQRARK